MKIIVDLRIRNSKPHELWWAHLWMLSYQSHYKEDSVSWIGFEGTTYPASFNTFSHILTSPNIDWLSGWKFRKQLKQLKGDIIFSFSEEKLPTNHTPIIHHISSYQKFLTPQNKSKLPYGKDFYLTTSASKEKELIERFSVEENHIFTINEWIPEYFNEHTSQNVFTQYSISDSYIIHDVGLNQETELLKLIEYWHIYNPPYQLLILGEIGGGYENYKDKIREFGLLEKVRMVGLLSEEYLHEIYLKASGWIFIGYHYSGSTGLTRAISYRLPLVLSNLDDFKNIGGERVNHKTRIIEEDISELLTENKKLSGKIPSTDVVLAEYRCVFEKIGKKEIKS